jgi:hypothetical protein
MISKKASLDNTLILHQEQYVCSHIVANVAVWAASASNLVDNYPNMDISDMNNK